MAYGNEYDDSDEDGSLGNPNGFSSRDVSLSRGQLEARSHLGMMKESCSFIEDDDQAVQCFSIAQEAEQELDDVFRGEESQRRVDRIRDRDRTINISEL